jgi:hypothetical protein
LEFHRNQTPNLSYLKFRSNHSATSATDASVEDERRETSATDTRIAREEDNDTSDEVEVEINTSEKTNANNQEKGNKIGTNGKGDQQNEIRIKQ